MPTGMLACSAAVALTSSRASREALTSEITVSRRSSKR